MDSKHRQQLWAQYEEAAMMLLMEEYAEADGARLLEQYAEDEKKGQISAMPSGLEEACIRRIQDRFSRQNRRNRLRRFFGGLRNAAVWGLSLLGLLAALVFFTDSIRVPLLNFFLNRGVSSPTLQAPPSGGREALIRELKAALDGEYALLVEEGDESGDVFLLFQNQDQDILSLNISRSDGQVLVDTEDARSDTAEIHGIRVYLILDQEECRMLWVSEEEEQLYDLYAVGMEGDGFRALAHRILAVYAVG